MKKFYAIFAALVIALALGSTDASAVTRGGVTVNSWKIVSVRPTSFTSVDGVVELALESTRRKTYVSDINGIIYNKYGEMFIIGKADNIVIPKGSSVIYVTGHGSLSSYSAMLNVLSNLSINPADYTADITATLKMGSKSRKVEMQGVPLSMFLQ